MAAIFWDKLSQAVFLEDTSIAAIDYAGRLPCRLPVTELLAESVALAGIALARLTDRTHAQVTVDGRLCAFWGLTSCKTIDWSPPEPWDALSDFFKGSDGWIRLHTNAPHHKKAAIKALGNVQTHSDISEVIAKLPVAQLEQKIIDEGGAAAQLFSLKAWRNHPQGLAIEASPLIEWVEKLTPAPKKLQDAVYASDRPLAGVRVLDLTRVLAGPVATRTLAGYGAEVLRIDPENWDDPGLLHDTTVGKKCAGLNLKASADRSVFEELLRQSDIFIHGYRPGALAKLGYDNSALDQINPSRIDVSLSAYGWEGPWANRRGFDSLVQFSSGIAYLCADANGVPGKLPVQALDHAAGYILAACCIEALRIAKAGRIKAVRTSLAKVAWLLCQEKTTPVINQEIPKQTEYDFNFETEQSDWGALKRLLPPLIVEGMSMRWDIPAGNLRRHPAKWDAASI
ncbi:CoA transferase [Thalassospira povalilytica]|uniref:CoA transferase n=1 Tax=Thalassospira povalilytica TaxID=732237 RepID=UPI001D191707|nr:CoA transferase [Thalassospira povalilytica]MCC4242085.1 CoA transferase [Thalassospira povalilytica]